MQELLVFLILGYVIVEKARIEGINIFGISGPSAVITALSISGFKIDSFTFYGFVPRENKDRKNIFQKIKDSKEEIFVLYESPKRIIKLIEDINLEFPESEICVCSDITKLHEKSIAGQTNEILEALKNDEKAELGEYTVVLQIRRGGFPCPPMAPEVSLESLIIDYIIKNHGATIKTAVNEIAKSGISKKELYNARNEFEKYRHID